MVTSGNTARIGKKFNKLTIIEFSHRKNGKTYWKCRCDCGKEPIIVLGNIVTGAARSCGCLRTHKYPQGESGLKSLYFKYRMSAKKEGRVFELSLEEFKKITSLSCAYCGGFPNKVEAAAHTKKQTVRDYTSYLYNGIDRIDSSKGYEKDNVTPCCRWCNIIKRERSVDELKSHINRIVGHLCTD